MLNNVRFQYCSWEEMPAEYQAFFTQLRDNEVQEGKAFYSLYAYWYNIAHQCAHILRKQYGTVAESRWVEEAAVNDLAVAYWRAFGEHEKLALLEEWIHYALRFLPNPIPLGEDAPTHFDANYSTISSRLVDYEYLQFQWVMASLEKNLDLASTLRTLVTADARDDVKPVPRVYSEIRVDLPLIIIPDMRELLGYYGIMLPPVEVVREFTPSLQQLTFE